MNDIIKCINDLTVQRYIDGDLIESERTLVDQHLLLCQACTKKIQEQTEWALQVKWSLRNQPVESTKIPEFRIGANLAPRRTKTVLHHPLLKVAAIITIILGGALILTKQHTPVYQPTAEDIQLWMQETSGNDANYDWHHRQLVLESAAQIENN
jgi:hypothetical protein